MIEFHKSWINKDEECDVDENMLTNKKHYRILAESEIDFDDSDEFDKKLRLKHKQIKMTTDFDETYGNFLLNYHTDCNIQNIDPEFKTITAEKNGKLCFSVETQPACNERDEMIETETLKVFRCIS